MLRLHPLLALMEHLTALSTRWHDRRRGVDGATMRGHIGEDTAYFHLRRLGFKVVAQRWESEFAPGEVDIVAWEGETLCFIEVKTRKQNAPIATEAAIDREKQQAMERQADAYVRELPWRDSRRPKIAIRFDAVLVHLREKGRPDVQLIRNVF